MKKTDMEKKLTDACGKSIDECSYEELYIALLHLTEEESRRHILPVNGRKLYYISAEFLIGKLLSNNLINLGIYDDVKTVLEKYQAFFTMRYENGYFSFAAELPNMLAS